MWEIVRSKDEIREAWGRAQAADFKADDEDYQDPEARACYALLQWLLGHDENNPTAEMGG